MRFIVSCLALLPLWLPMAFAEDFARAIWQAPASRAARQRALAAAARVESQGRLPDPELEAMVSRVDMPEGDNPMWGLGLRQNLLKRGERGAGRERALAVAAMMEAEAQAMVAELAAETTMSLSEADAAAQRAAVLDAQVHRMEQALSSLDSRMASRGGFFAERLSLQSAIASMRQRTDRERRMAADAYSEARARLGLAPDTPLPPMEFPDPVPVNVESSPEFRLASARVAEARAMGKMARASGRPMRAVSLRFEREEEDMGHTDVVGLAFMTELPLRSPKNAKADVRAARAEGDAAESGIEELRHRLAADLSRWQRAETFAVEARRIAVETGARLDAQTNALLRSAGVDGMGGGLSILMIVDLLERQADNEIQAITAEAESRAARAGLWRYQPLNSPETPGDPP